MLAAVAPGAHLPMAGVLASCAHATNPSDIPCCAWDVLWWTTVTARTPGVVRRSVNTGPGTEGTFVEAGQFVAVKLQKVSARVSIPALPPPELLEARTELRAPMAALVTNRASTSPLTKRKAALGLSRSRRPAMRVAGRFARVVMSRDPAVVNHGPARTSPTRR